MKKNDIEEILSYNDEKFVYSAYRFFLKREPDEQGLEYYLKRIRSGIDKKEILTQIHLSEEAKKINTQKSIDNYFLKEKKSSLEVISKFFNQLSNRNNQQETILKGINRIENQIYLHSLQNKKNIANIEYNLDKINSSIIELLKEKISHAKEIKFNETKLFEKKVVETFKQLNEAAEKIKNSNLEPLIIENIYKSSTFQNLDEPISSNIAQKQKKTINESDIKLKTYIYISPENGLEYNIEKEKINHNSYIQLIEHSGKFNAVFYASNNNIDPIFENELILHYVLFGEDKGWQPYSGFWPANYLKFNTDVAKAGAKPFLHYLQIGMSEGRTSLPLPPIEGGLKHTPVPTMRGAAFPKPHKIAVCLHIYYDDLWDYFEYTIKRLSHPFDFFVGIVDRGRDTNEVKLKILLAFPNAKIFVFPNHGRDIFPFVHMITAGLFDHYEAVCKMHTKKSPHREDGDFWRNHLVAGVLPEIGTDELVDKFLNDDELGILVADGQIYEGDQWWGSNNKTKVIELLHRIEVSESGDKLSFPAGSIYWLKKPIINLIRGMQLSSDDFEKEDSQLDGTTAHAFERILGYLADTAYLKVLQTSEVIAKSQPKQHAISNHIKTKPFVSCFYLPQFHSINENDAWWGTGYTEWIAASKAKPQFKNHYQPVTPVGTGFYDLTIPEVIGKQFQIAKSHGVDAFCIYYYCFDHGRRLLEKPVDNLLLKPEIDACFYLCWANESWTRNWDGLSGEILMSQSYLPGFEKQIAEDSVNYFKDKRYYRFNGTEPRFVIYRPGDIPDMAMFIENLRSQWCKLGFPKVNLGAVLFHLTSDITEEISNVFDFFIEMPPHGLVGADGWIYNKEAPTHDSEFPVKENFDGVIYSYPKLVEKSLTRKFPDFLSKKVIRGVMPSWDNTARRSNRAHICYGANPARFGYWISSLLELKNTSSEIMINSWNEWGEKAMIEPSCQYGMGYIESLNNSLLKYFKK